MVYTCTKYTFARTATTTPMSARTTHKQHALDVDAATATATTEKHTIRKASRMMGDQKLFSIQRTFVRILIGAPLLGRRPPFAAVWPLQYYYIHIVYLRAIIRPGYAKQHKTRARKKAKRALHIERNAFATRQVCVCIFFLYCRCMARWYWAALIRLYCYMEWV